MSSPFFESSGFDSSGFDSPGVLADESESVFCPSSDDRRVIPPIKRRRIHQSDNTAQGDDDFSSRDSSSLEHDETGLHSARTTSDYVQSSPRAASLSVPCHPPEGSFRYLDVENERDGVSESPMTDQRSPFTCPPEFVNPGSFRALTGRDIEKEEEARRMAEFLVCCERGKLSQRRIKTLLQTDVVACTESYGVLKNYIHSRNRVAKRYALMCPLEHMARNASDKGLTCKSSHCDQNVSENNRYWYRHVSEMVRALCSEENSFRLLMDGCVAAHRASLEEDSEVMYDFYDGRLFQKIYRQKLRCWNPKAELHVFLTFSTDGFQEFGTRTGSRNAWPLAFIVLNYPPHHRFKASNSLIASFIPGTHDSKHFDTFLKPVTDDLLKAMEGFEVVCFDNVTRKLFVHVMFATFDYPAASKCMGFAGHLATFFCRGCHKTLEHVSEAGGRYAIPIGNDQLRSKTIHGKDRSSLQWLLQEKPEPRSDAETRAVWRKIKSIMSSNDTRKNTQITKIAKNTGIARIPVMGLLPFDFVNSIPYDPMHLIFLGWTRLLLKLFFGMHPKVESHASFVLSSTKQDEINRCLRKGFIGIPSEWGRKPESIEFLSGFKAEDLKLMGLFLGPIMFSGPGISRKVAQLWGTVSNIIHICCDPTPLRDDVNSLKFLVQRAHALFTDTFYKQRSYAYCFTPTTHAMLHLPEMLENCGPLTNVSQFIVERLIGEIGRLIGSMSRPEANLFHKTHFLFGLRLLRGGLHREDVDDMDDEEDDGKSLSNETESSHQLDHATQSTEEIHEENGFAFLDRGSTQNSIKVKQEIMPFIKDYLGTNARDVRIGTVKTYDRCRIGSMERSFDVESEQHFHRRHQRNPYCRQKFWVAGVYEKIDDGNCINFSYYGKIKLLLQAQVFYQKPHEQEQVVFERNVSMVKVEWQYGITRDKNTGMPFVRLRGERKGSVRHVLISTERIGCMNRLIAFFDYGGRRYFMDIEKRRLETSTTEQLDGTL